LRSYGKSGRDRQRIRGLFSGIIRGVSSPREGSKILTFLLRSLRSSLKVNSANYFALCTFSEVVLHSPGPMRQGFLCAIGDSKVCVHTSSAKLAPNSQNTSENNKHVEERTLRPSKFIANSSILGIKVGMRERTQSNPGARPSAEGPPRGIAWG
jgi:hypothetical protein